MPFIYKPFRQTMSPNNTTIDPTQSNIFSVIISGQVCSGYRLKIYDMNNTLITGASTNIVQLSTPLYDGDTLNVTVASDKLVAGNKYKWQMELFSSFPTMGSVDLPNNAVTLLNHNLLAGDMVYIQSSTSIFPTAFSHRSDWAQNIAYNLDDKIYYATNSTYYKCILAHTSSASILPTNATYWATYTAEGLKSDTKYYIRPYNSNKIMFFENIEAAKNNQGVMDITAGVSGSDVITIANVAVSDEMPFNVYNLPVVTLTVPTVTTQYYTFIPTYTHAQNIMVNRFQALLYDSNGDLIDDSGIIYSSNVKYYFDGFLSDSNYGIRFIITNNIGQIVDTGIVNFNVSYSSPNVTITAIAENICKDSCVKVSWANVIQIAGTITGGTFEYIPNYVKYGWYGLKLNTDAVLSYSDVNMGEISSLPMFLWKPLSTAFTGIIAEFSNTVTGDYVKIYYDGSKFYQDRNGVILNNLPFSLTTDGVYLLAVVGDKLLTNLITTSTL